MITVPDKLLSRKKHLNIWHRGEKSGAWFTVCTSRKKRKLTMFPLENMPKIATTFEEALAIVLYGSFGLMRVSGYKCNNHNKIHKYTFHSKISFCPGTERMYGFDTKQEVINWANQLNK